MYRGLVLPLPRAALASSFVMSIPLVVCARGMKDRNQRVYINKIGGPVNELLDNARDALARFTKPHPQTSKFVGGDIDIAIGKFSLP